MIDIDIEQPLTLEEVGKLPFVNKSQSQIYRWTTSGLRGVTLETIQVGGCRKSSRAAVIRFFERLTTPDAVQTSRTPSQRRRAIDRAEQELARAGGI